MFPTVKKLWSFVVVGNTDKAQRQIQLCNQIALLFAMATMVPYQLFFIMYDFALYRSIFLANLVFIAIYLTVLLLNHQRRYATAKKVLLVNTCCHILIMNFYISAGSGVHLYYFTLAGIVLFLYQKLRTLVYFGVLATFGTLFTITHFLFAPDTARTPIPSPWAEIMYSLSVAAVLGLLGVFLLFFRNQIDQAETELNKKNEYLKTLSHTDALTGLANRRALDKYLELEWSRLSRRPASLSVIMCDVDHFKLFNDLYGHDGGDDCLQQVAKALKSVLGRPTDMIARYGGEEFAVILPSTDAAGARHIGNKLCQAVEDLKIPNDESSTSAYVTISVGASSIEHVASNLDFIQQGSVSLLKCADQALYQAKETGRNQVVFQPYSMPTID